jgi:hypothetical protein
MREELPGLVEMLNDITPQSGGAADEDSEVLPESSDPSKKKLEMTTNTIATKLNSKSGADLVLAACAHLNLVKGQDSFKRANVLGEMKLASNFYKQTFNNNLSKSLKSLVKNGKLLETAQDTYALDSKEKARLESVLSET